MRTEIVDSLEMRKCLCWLSIERESRILKYERNELAYIPRELIESLTKVTDVY